MLNTVLPPQLRFQRLVVEVPEVVLQTESGPFSLDAVSGGVSTIIDLTWQIYMYSLEHDEFAVIIDEPEDHLHPELQLRLLPTLMQAFQSFQFIISTHDPFMVSSVPDSNVYVLRFDDARRVASQELDFINKGGTANDVRNRGQSEPLCWM